MLKVHKLSFLFSLLIMQLSSMTKSDAIYLSQVYERVQKSLELIQKQSHGGDIACSRALYDFYHNLKDSAYKFDYPVATNLLQKYGLLNEREEIPQEVSSAFTMFGEKCE